MDERTERKEQKKLKTKANVKSILLIVGGCAAILVVAALLVVMGVRANKPSAAPAADDENVVDTTALLGETTTAGTHRGFPVSFSGSGILQIAPVNGGLYVLTKDTLCFVSTTGAYRAPIVQSFVEPVLKTSGAYALVFDRPSGKFLLANEKKQLLLQQSENGQQINTATVTAKGNFAVAAKGGSYTSLLTYYNRAGKVLFSWECAKEHIVSVAVSDNGKNLLCAALSAKNGEIYTKLYLLNIKKTETIWEYAISGVAAIDCFFAGGNDVVCVCGDRRILLNTKKTEDAAETYAYPAAALCCDSDENGNTAVVTQKVGSFDTYEITLLDKRNEARCTAETDSKVLDVVCSGKRAYLLTEDAVLRVRSSGKCSVVTSLFETELGLALSGGDVFHYSQRAVYKN